MKYKEGLFAVFASIAWIASHELGNWEYDILSVIFPLVWMIILAFVTDDNCVRQKINE
jgi:hypothetical protein